MQANFSLAYSQPKITSMSYRAIHLAAAYAGPGVLCRLPHCELKPPVTSIGSGSI